MRVLENIFDKKLVIRMEITCKQKYICGCFFYKWSLRSVTQLKSRKRILRLFNIKISALTHYLRLIFFNELVPLLNKLLETAKCYISNPFKLISQKRKIICSSSINVLEFICKHTGASCFKRWMKELFHQTNTSLSSPSVRPFDCNVMNACGIFRISFLTHLFVQVLPTGKRTLRTYYISVYYFFPVS